MEFSGFYVAHGFRLLHPRACTHRVRNTGYVLHTFGCCAKHNLQNRCKRNWKTIFKGNLFSFGACAKKHMAYRKKYKPCILKYKALISKYMPCIFPQLYTSEKQKLTKRRKQPFSKQALHIYSLAHSNPQTLPPTAHFARP